MLALFPFALLLFFRGASPSPLTGYNQALRFSRDVSLEKVVLMSPDLAPLQHEFSVCGWVKYYRVDARRFWFSYNAPGEDNFIVLGRKVIETYFHSKEMTETALGTVAPLTEYEWNNVCLSWSSASQRQQLFYNGVLVAEELREDAAQLSLGGTIALGQEQDAVGGGFDISQAFGGEIYGLQMLDRALSRDEVRAVYEAGLCASSAPLPHTYLTWGDFLEGERRGEVEVVEVGCSVWDLLREFQGVEIGELLIANLKRTLF